ncbi:MAG: transglutaminase domain-containing protein, partial [Caulobacter sp.]
MFGSAAVLAAAFAAGALAQTSDPLAALPSVRIARGQLAAPSTVSAWNGGVVDGLCQNFSEITEICPSGGRPISPEVKALAASLNHDPDLIYEYVRNTVDTEFIFGAHKGALGVLIDHSGSAFDQAMLMVELLRESGYAARYKFGTLTLTGAEFLAWTGFSDAAAACRFIATGGIPGIVNGSTDPSCGYSGAVSSVTLSHIWIEADIGGASYFFDPAYKPYEHRSGLNLASAMGFDGPALWAGVTSGMNQGAEAGVGYVSNLNQEQLSAKLQQFAASTDARLRQSDLTGADMVDVIGGQRVIAASRPAGGWRLAKPANYIESASWNGIPSAFRNKIFLRSALASTVADASYGLLNAAFFTDEIYGRRLEVTAEPVGSAADAVDWIPTLSLDGVHVQEGNAFPLTGSLVIPLGIDVDHPFPNGYGDAHIDKTIDIFSPATIVHGWGRTSAQLVEKWSSEQVFDKTGYVTTKSAGSDIEANTAIGDLTRSKVAASWLAQSSLAGEIISEISGARFVPLHSVGVVSADQTIAPVPESPGSDPNPVTSGFVTNDEVTVVDVESSFGVVSRSNNTIFQRAAMHSIAVVDAALEGGVLADTTDSPDAISSASRIAWGNRPEVGETPDVSSRRVYQYFSTNDAEQAAGLSVYDNSIGPIAAFQDAPALSQSEVDFMRGKLSGAVKSYVNAGFEVVASNEASLGPGHRAGTEYAAWTVSFASGVTAFNFILTVSCRPVIIT